MKGIVFFTTLIFSSLFLSSCLIGGANSGQDSLHILTSELDIETDNFDSRRTQLCENSSECIDSCEDVYGDDDEDEDKVEACIKLSYRIAMQFEEILETIENPTDSGLRNINDRAFEELLDISLEPWVDAVRRVSQSEARSLLVWIAREDEISSAIKKAYENYETEFDKYEGVHQLFKKLTNSVFCEDFYGYNLIDGARVYVNFTRTVTVSANTFRSIGEGTDAINIFSGFCPERDIFGNYLW